MNSSEAISIQLSDEDEPTCGSTNKVGCSQGTPSSNSLTDNDKNIHVLLIEDNPGDAFLVRKFLTRGPISDIKLTHTDTLKKAGTFIESQAKIDTVLLDLNLPDSVGEKTFIKLLSLIPKVPVIILTGLTEKDVARKLLDKGAYSFIRKDEMTESSLFNSIYSCLKRRGVEKRLVEEKLKAEQANREKTKFLGNMSHELRTPLTAILGFTEVLEQSGTLSEANLSHLKRLKSNSKHLQRLVNDLLDLSKVQTGHIDISLVSVSLESFLDDFFATYIYLAKRKNIDVECRSIGTIPSKIETDPCRLKQILTNILVNSIKFSDFGPIEITIELKESPTTASGHALVFEVKDKGCGIPQDKIKELFKPYGRAGVTNTEGSGLGLVVAKGLANLLGGNVVLSKTSPEGSTFQALTDPGIVAANSPKTRYQWPLKDPVSIRTDASTDSNSKTLNNLTILVIEDHIDLIDLYTLVLEKHGAKVDIAQLGSEGMVKALNNKHDVVLLDFGLPDMEGTEVASQLRSQGFSKPIFMLTAHTLPEYKNAALESGCTGYLTKPVNTKKLIKLLEELIKNE